MVEHSLVADAPLRGAGRSPGAEVLVDGVAPFVHLVEDARLLDGTPIDLGDEDGIGLDDRHLLLELGDELALALLDVGVAVHLPVVAAVPARIDMHGIADVIALDGVDGVVGIARLEARTRHPDDALEAVGPNHIDDGLEVVVQGTVLLPFKGRLEGVFAPYINRLVGKLDAHQPGVRADEFVAGDDVPDFHEVLLVVVAHLEERRTDARRPHDDVLPVGEGFLGNRHIERLHVVLEALRVEVADVGLASRTLPLAPCSRIKEVLVVGPSRVEVEAEDVAVGYLEACQHLLEVIEAASETFVVVAPAPPAAVEPGIGRVHHSVQHDAIAAVVHQPSPIDMQGRQRLLSLCQSHHRAQAHNKDSCQSLHSTKHLSACKDTKIIQNHKH